ncbi:hypothetical protein LCGC14_1209460 [marine sediment metagenome]|uniref:Ubiquitin-like domain-containing protein n=1 Tax=marine sediment metagenome TaxID=412755 RepID=A0A0F9M1Y1_9ZZZZ
MKEEKVDLEYFQEELERRVKVRVVSSKGHDEWDEIPEIALSRIQHEVETSKKWVYIDGVQQNANNLTVDKLLEAEYIILTNALVGG